MNFIYLVCHDLGRHLGCYGALVESPNLDAFARSGVKFNRAFCNSPACSPSRCCAMTGKYAHTSGAVGLSHMGWPLSMGQKTVVDHLNSSGYETVHTGFNHERHPGQNRYKLDFETTWDDWQSDNAINQAIAYLGRRRDEKGGRPFYLNIGTHEVHASSFTVKYDRVYGGAVPPEKVWIPPYSPDQPPLRSMFGKFQASIKFLDTHFQRLLDAVEELGLSDDTMVIFTTDHGISNMRSKGTLYDAGVETALIVRPPGGSVKNRTVDHLMQNIDLAPTILDAAGIEIPEDMQGKSFWPLLSGREYSPHKEIFTERNFHGEKPEGRPDEDYLDLYDPVRAVRTKDFHYIRWFKPELRKRPFMFWECPQMKESNKFDEIWPDFTQARNAEELYHVALDPCEFRNLADHPEYSGVKAELSSKLEKWMRETGDFATGGIPPGRPAEPGWGENWPMK